jgi:hypothetical protein
VSFSPSHDCHAHYCQREIADDGDRRTQTATVRIHESVVLESVSCWCESEGESHSGVVAIANDKGAAAFMIDGDEVYTRSPGEKRGRKKKKERKKEERRKEERYECTLQYSAGFIKGVAR